MRVLVTGARGFLGRAVVAALCEAGHTPYELTTGIGDRAEPRRVLTADIRCSDDVAQAVVRARPHGICHLAALTSVRGSLVDPGAYHDVNVAGTANLLSALDCHWPGRRATHRFSVIFASTAAVYGACADMADERHPTRPENPYGMSKLAAEKLLQARALAGKVGVTTLRFFNLAGATCGVGDGDTRRVIPAALNVAAGQEERLVVNGDGPAVGDFTHVTDAAAAVVAALETNTPGEHRTYNVGGAVQAAVSDVITVAESVTGRRIPQDHRPGLDEPALLIADNTLAHAELGWRPIHTDLERIVQDAWHAISDSRGNLTGLMSVPRPRSLGEVAGQAGWAIADIATRSHVSPHTVLKLWSNPRWMEHLGFPSDLQDSHLDALPPLKAYVDNYRRGRWLTDLQACGTALSRDLDDPPTTSDLQAYTRTELPAWAIDEALRSLSARNASILRTRLGIGHDGPVPTYEQVGIRFGITRERVRQIVQCSPHKLARTHPAARAIRKLAAGPES